MHENKSMLDRAIERGQRATQRIGGDGMKMPTAATTETTVTKRSIGHAIASGALKGPYSKQQDGGVVDGYWHKDGHRGPLDCTGCSMEHLERLLPE